MNKILTILFLISFIGYTITNPLGGDSPFKWVVYILMILLPFNFMMIPRVMTSYNKKLGLWFIFFTLLFIAQLVFSKEKLVNNLILWGSFFCLSMLMVTCNLKKCVWRLLFLALIVDFSLGFPDLVYSIRAAGYADGWKGMFQNANTNSIFLCSTLIAALLSCPCKKTRIIVLIFILLGIIATRSRNALMVYLIVIGGLLLEFRLSKFQKWFPLVLILILAFAGYYMFVIEPITSQNAMELLGKKKGSAGRSLQIIYMITHFDLTLWGNGRYINSIVADHTGFPVHNMFIASFYVLGIFISIAYLSFIYWLYYHSMSYKLKIILLALHFYFFFEPGYFFCVQLCYFLPIFVVCVNYWSNSTFSIKNAVQINIKIPKYFSNL